MKDYSFVLNAIKNIAKEIKDVSDYHHREHSLAKAIMHICDSSLEDSKKVQNVQPEPKS